jgi:hypothetical protein
MPAPKELQFVVENGDVVARVDLSRPDGRAIAASFSRPEPKKKEPMPQYTQATCDAAISRAVAEGKIPEDRRGAYQMQFSQNPQGTLDLLARLQSVDPSVFAATTVQVSGPRPPTADEEAYPAEWLNHLRDAPEMEPVNAALEGKARPRIIVEH